LGSNQWRLQWLTARFLSAGRPRPFATIALNLAGPNAKAVRRTTQFACDRRQRRSFALIFIAVFHNQPNRTLAELTFSRIFNALSGNGEYAFEVFFFCVCSITGNSPRVLPSGKPGAVQFAALFEGLDWKAVRAERRRQPMRAG
jgi:hypothetical protein